MKTLMQRIYDELKYLDKVDSQSDFGDKLGYTKSYAGILIKSNAPLSDKIQSKMHEVFGISIEWLASNGKEGTMFANKTNPPTNPNAKSLEEIEKDSLYLNPEKNTGDKTMSESEELRYILRMAVEANIQHAKNCAELIKKVPNAPDTLKEEFSGKKVTATK